MRAQYSRQWRTPGPARGTIGASWGRDGHDPYANFSEHLTNELILAVEPDDDSEHFTNLGDVTADDEGLMVASGDPQVIGEGHPDED